MVEKEYIERETLCNHIRNGDGTSMQKLFAECCVMSAPIAADVVEVVRCKDCKHWDDEYKDCTTMGLTAFGDSYFHENSFCSYGERKEK